jgi:hypothetical protein
MVVVDERAILASDLRLQLEIRGPIQNQRSAARVIVIVWVRVGGDEPAGKDAFEARHKSIVNLPLLFSRNQLSTIRIP